MKNIENWLCIILYKIMLYIFIIIIFQRGTEGLVDVIWANLNKSGQIWLIWANLNKG